MDRLLRIGFSPVGFWILNERLNIQFDLNSNQNTRNILYAFISNGEIKYIGKTINTLNNRMTGYQNPGPTQNTNIRVNALIKRSLEADTPVDVFILADNGLLSYGGFKINLAAGLEDTLIYEINPEWNYSGKNKIKLDNESEDINKIGKPIPEIKKEIMSKGNFIITLGQTYFNQGFFNVPVGYSESFDSNNSKIEILLGDTIHSIEGYINRHANRNNSPRIMGGLELKDWIQSNFKPEGKLKVEILSAISIQLKKV
jgi:hypothetical protein